MPASTRKTTIVHCVTAANAATESFLVEKPPIESVENACAVAW